MRVCYYLCDQVNTTKSRGIWVYTKELLLSLRAQNKVDIILLTSPDFTALPEFDCESIPFATGTKIKRLIADQVNQAFLPNADIYHYPKGFLPCFRHRKQPHISSVLDTIVVHYNKYYRNKNSVYLPFELDYWIMMLKRTLIQTDRLITISNKSAELISEYCDDNKIKVPPITVTYLASKYQNAPIMPVEKLDYVLHLATKHPYKKTMWLLETWSELGKVYPNLPKLLLVGTLDDSSKKLLANLGNAEYLPPVSDNDLELLFRKARALIFPSELEGFGFPALEAYLLGTPAMYAANTSVDEILAINGRSAPGRFFFDLDDFKRALNEVLDITSEEIQTLQNELSAKFSWEKTAEKTLEAYNLVMS